MIIELDKYDEQSLVVWKRGDNIQFVICTMFDESKPEGNMWYWGYYYDSLDTAYFWWNRLKNGESIENSARYKGELFK